MPNALDEVSGPTNPSGRDVNVIARQIPAEIGPGTKAFEAGIWVAGVLLAVMIAALAASSSPLGFLGISLAGVVPGLIFQLMKTNALAYLRKLEQKVQADASQIDNFLEQRVIILQNLASLVSRSVELDKDVMKSVAVARSGRPVPENSLSQRSADLDAAFARINVAVEAYPTLRAQDNIAEAMRQNSYLQREVTAARALYNDTVSTWNRDIFAWPTKLIVAAKQGFTTRIPFTASQDVKVAARADFFDV